MDLETIFKDLKGVSFVPDPTFATLEAAESIRSFVRFEDGALVMSTCFREGLDLLAHVTGGKGRVYEAVVADLRLLQQGAPPATLKNLQTFIDYQVYKVGEHYRTHDEQKWTKDIAKDVMLKAPQVKELYDRLVRDPVADLKRAIEDGNRQAIKDITGDEEEIDRATLDKAKKWEGAEFERLREAAEARAAAPLLRAIEQEVAKHYMCRMRYTKPIPALVDRATPGFIRDRLRFQDTGQPIFLFETSNGVTIAYDSTKFASHGAARDHFADRLPSDAKIEFTPFDPAKLMIATMQVPVMSEPVTLHLSLADHPALGGPVERDVIIGKYPEEMGYQMTDEPAGVFRRSYNSQRVTEIQGLDDHGQPVAFQMKGAGVPAYGFDLANAGNASMGEFTGSEFFKLNAEMGSIGLRSFATSAFGNDRITPQTLGMVLAADRDHASSSGKRNGAISFRADYSLGVRLENVLRAETETALVRIRRVPQAGTEPDATVKAMRDKMGLRPEDMDAHKRAMLNRMVRNLAITHLFGMQYDDSSMKDLSDVGLAGEFSDSGTLRNLDPSTPAQQVVEKTAFVDKGVRTMLGSDANTQFPILYAETMVGLLQELAIREGESGQRWLRDLTARLTAALKDPIDRALFLMELVVTLGGPSSSPTPIQQAFYTHGIRGYTGILCRELQLKLDDMNRFKARRFVAGADQPYVCYKRLEFARIEDLNEALNPLLDHTTQEALNLLDDIATEMQAIPPDKQDALGKLLEEARRFVREYVEDDERLRITNQVSAFLAVVKREGHLSPEQAENLLKLEFRRVGITDQLAKIRAGVTRLRSDLEAETGPRDRGRELYDAAISERRFQQAIAGLNRSQAISSITEEIGKRREAAQGNDIVLGSIDRRLRAAMALIDKYLPQ
ncbi:MAG TPA: hypothetical protein VNL77_05285 [Roseiflexaceae bacterium]|nr:hypothetical protein [Roseiflexaceae bacterium]